MAQAVTTHGKTIKDFAEVTYWYRPARHSDRNPNASMGEYLTDINNPYGRTFDAAEATRTAPQSRFINENWTTFSRWTDSDTQLAVNVSNRYDTIEVISINKIDERDYVVQFVLRSGPEKVHAYVVRDCNHYQHAFNRFAKRVREEINPRLGLGIITIDARESNEVAPEMTLQEHYATYIIHPDRGEYGAVWLADHADAFAALHSAAAVALSLSQHTFAPLPIEVRSGDRVCARFGRDKVEFFRES